MGDSLLAVVAFLVGVFLGVLGVFLGVVGVLVGVSAASPSVVGITEGFALSVAQVPSGPSMATRRRV